MLLERLFKTDVELWLKTWIIGALSRLNNKIASAALNPDPTTKTGSTVAFPKSVKIKGTGQLRNHELLKSNQFANGY